MPTSARRACTPASRPQPRISSIERRLRTVARGCVERSRRRSTSRASTPWRLSSTAAPRPAGPAPTMSTGTASGQRMGSVGFMHDETPHATPLTRDAVPGRCAPGGVLPRMFFPKTRVLAVLATLTLSATAAQAAPPPDIASDEMRACAALGAKPPGSATGRAQARRIASGVQRRRPEDDPRGLPRPGLRRRPVSRMTVSGTTTSPARRSPTAARAACRRRSSTSGSAGPADYAGKDASGKIVMVRRDEAFHRTSQLDQISPTAARRCSTSPGRRTT